MASRLGQHLLRAKSKAENFRLFARYPCYFFFICCLTAPWPTFEYYKGNSITRPMLITAFGQSIFCPKVTGGWVGSLYLVECPDLHPVFLKCGNARNTQNSYSLTLWWPLELNNTSLDAKFSVKNFSFADKSNQ